MDSPVNMPLVASTGMFMGRASAVPKFTPKPLIK